MSHLDRCDTRLEARASRVELHAAHCHAIPTPITFEHEWREQKHLLARRRNALVLCFIVSPSSHWQMVYLYTRSLRPEISACGVNKELVHSQSWIYREGRTIGLSRSHVRDVLWLRRRARERSIRRAR